MNLLNATKKLSDLRKLVKGKTFGEAPEYFKQIESLKVQIKHLKDTTKE